jgi:hypothetical protein
MTGCWGWRLLAVSAARLAFDTGFNYPRTEANGFRLGDRMDGEWLGVFTEDKKKYPQVSALPKPVCGYCIKVRKTAGAIPTRAGRCCF